MQLVIIFCLSCILCLAGPLAVSKFGWLLAAFGNVLCVFVCVLLHPCVVKGYGAVYLRPWRIKGGTAGSFSLVW